MSGHSWFNTSGVQAPLWVQLPLAPQVAVGLPMNPEAQTAEHSLWNRLNGLREQFQVDALTVLLGRAGRRPHVIGVHAPV